MPTPVQTPVTTPVISPSESPWTEQWTSPDEICPQQVRELGSPDCAP